MPNTPSTRLPGKVLVQAGLEADAGGGEQCLAAPELQVDAAERGAAIAGD